LKPKIAVLIVVALFLAPGVVFATTPTTWSSTGSMSVPRTAQVQVVLADGRVLVAGGTSNGAPIATAEIYSAGSQSWALTGSMATPRSGAAAALLSSGQVLVAGGTTTGNAVDASAELYDPATGSWSPTGSMAAARTSFSATTLGSGLVLVTGGCPSVGCSFVTALTSRELYDPSTGSWSPTGSLVDFSASRSGHTAALLTSGKVLVTSLTSTNLPGNPEVYDPVAGTWSTVSGPSYQVPTYSTAVQLPSGNVLILGGYPAAGAFAIGSELYNPATDSTTLGPNHSHASTQVRRLGLVRI
jgi:hypothetical protein